MNGPQHAQAAFLGVLHFNLSLNTLPTSSNPPLHDYQSWISTTRISWARLPILTALAPQRPPLASNPKTELDQNVEKLVGNISNWWSGFAKKSQDSINQARKEMESKGGIVNYAKSEYAKLETSIGEAQKKARDQSLATAPQTEDDRRRVLPSRLYSLRVRKWSDPRPAKASRELLMTKQPQKLLRAATL